MDNTKDILKKYERKLEKEIGSAEYDFSKEYSLFRQEMVPQLTKFEKICKSLNFIKIKLSEKDKKILNEKIKEARIDVTPEQVASVASFSLIIVFFIGIIISSIVFILTKIFPFLLLGLFLIFSLFLFYFLYTTPSRLANYYRLKASSQMVPCILYVVAYMKHTSNLERAIAFAATHLSPPLSLDLKKVFWDVETGKYSSVRESLNVYLETWRETNVEFIEAFHLIESSLYEPDEIRRIAILERALQVVLDGVYEKMLKYTHSIRGPLTNLYMLGIILPTLSIALLPLASTLLQGMIKWYHVFVLFDMIIPFFVFYLTNEILSRRPGGYGETESLENNPEYSTFVNKKFYITSFLIVLPLIIIGFLPFIFQTSLIKNLGLKNDYTFEEIGLSFLGDVKIFDFKTIGNMRVGPFGPVALLLSLSITLAISLFFSISFLKRTKEIIKVREKSKKLEEEFASSLFQLGNRLGDGIPAEIAFSHVAKSVKGQTTEGFFNIVSSNIHQLGMSLEEAIFNKRRGAIIYYPSSLIATSMKILIESVKKGLQIAARSLISISEYVKNIHRVNERLKDLLAEITSDMRSNITFLAPLLAGIVVGLAGMITTVLNKLQIIMGQMEIGGGIGGMPTNFLQMLDLNAMIPPFFLQISIGIYLIEIIFILSSTLVTIESGSDKVKIIHETGKNLRNSIFLYIIVALISTIALSLLVGFAMSGLGG